MFTIKTYLSNQGFLAGIVPSCSAAPLFLESDSKTIRALLLFDIFSERITHTEREVKRWENLIATLHSCSFKFHRKKNKQKVYCINGWAERSVLTVTSVGQIHLTHGQTNQIGPLSVDSVSVHGPRGHTWGFRIIYVWLKWVYRTTTTITAII